MLRKILCIIFLFLCVSQINAEEEEGVFDFAFNIGAFGWSGGKSYRLEMANLFIEHTPTNIGVKISPLIYSWENLWVSEPESQTSIINLGLYYNFFYIISDLLELDINNYESRKGSFYGLLGPFVSFHYLEHNTGIPYNKNNFRLNMGIQFLTLIDIGLIHEGVMPFGLQIFNLEFGYSFRHDGKNGPYFTISTDIVVALVILGAYIAGSVAAD